MSGIYIHIPFCRSKCAYCNFFSVASKKLQDSVVASIKKELVLQQYYLEEAFVETIYFGGGTPSYIEPEHIFSILETIFQHYRISDCPEITLEANPDDLSPKYLSAIAPKINRLSIGIQSFIDSDLQLLGRKHDATRAKNALADARLAGFNNISIDLIYGISEHMENWEKNLADSILFSPEHISAYALTIEERSILYKKIQQGICVETSDVNTENQYLTLVEAMKNSGYEHYEISNFSKPDFQSKHNSAYWNGTKYLGIGPSAHSFNGTSRQWNVAQISAYCQSIEQSKIPAEIEFLNEVDVYNEYVMLNLRRNSGIDIQKLTAKFGEKSASDFKNALLPYLASGQVIELSGIFTLTEEAFLISDSIISSLFKKGEW